MRTKDARHGRIRLGISDDWRIKRAREWGLAFPPRSFSRVDVAATYACACAHATSIYRVSIIIIVASWEVGRIQRGFWTWFWFDPPKKKKRRKKIEANLARTLIDQERNGHRARVLGSAAPYEMIPIAWHTTPANPTPPRGSGMKLKLYVKHRYNSESSHTCMLMKPSSREQLIDFIYFSFFSFCFSICETRDVSSERGGCSAYSFGRGENEVRGSVKRPLFLSGVLVDAKIGMIWFMKISLTRSGSLSYMFRPSTFEF